MSGCSCPWCGKPRATEDDYDRYEGGEGTHLCWADPHCEMDGDEEVVAALRAENKRLRNAIEIEREGQRSMARALSEINRLSRLDVAIGLASDAPFPPRDEVREAAEALRHKMREVYADSRYMNVWATAQERLGPYSGPDWIAESAALDAALARLETLGKEVAP